jgi:hypothetical protein
MFTSSEEVSKIFNEFFINVAKDIGDKSIKINKEHPSVMKISENNTINNKLNFKHVSEEFVTKQINSGPQEIPLIGHEWHAQRSYKCRVGH